MPQPRIITLTADQRYELFMAGLSVDAQADMILGRRPDLAKKHEELLDEMAFGLQVERVRNGQSV